MSPWEALLEIFLNFGVPLGAEGAPFGLKKASFFRSDFLMIFGVRGPLHFGRVGGMSGTPGRTRSMLKLANISKHVLSTLFAPPCGGRRI